MNETISTIEKFKGLEIEIPRDVAKTIAKSFEEFPNPTLSIEAMRYFLTTSSSIISRILPFEIADTLFQIRYNLINPSFIKFKGLQIDEFLPPTPADGCWSKLKQTFVSEALLLGFAQQLGTPFGFVNEKDGKILHQICPVKGKERTSSSASSSKSLGWHIEIAYHELLRPRYVSLICLRQDHEKNAITTVVDLRNVISNLPNWALDELRKPNFIFSIPESFNESACFSLPRPIIMGEFDLPEFVLDFKGMKPANPSLETYAAIELLEQEMNHPNNINNIILEKGDLLFIPNRYTAHGRSDFIPHYDGFDRWLQRVYITDSIWASRSTITNNVLIFN